MLWLLLALGGPQDDKAAEEALDAFKAAMRSSVEAERVAAVVEVSKIKHPKVLQKLVGLLSVDGVTVRLAATKGISEFFEQRKPASAALLGALAPNAKLPPVQVGILEAVAVLKDPASLPALHKLFDDKDALVAKAAVSAAAAFRSGTSMDPLLDALKKCDKAIKAADAANVTAGTVAGYEVSARDEAERKRGQELRPVILKALQEISGESFPASADWHAWWAKNKATFRPR